MRHKPYKVQLHSNGRYWIARWYDGDGKRQTRGVGAKSRFTSISAAQQCAKIERDLRLEAAGGVPTIATLEARTLGRSRGYKPATLVGYRAALAYFRRFAEEHRWGEARRIDEVTKAEASDFKDWLLGVDEGESQMALNTAIKHLRAMRSLYFMVADELESPLPNPFARRRWAGEKVAQDWAEISHADLRKLMKASRTQGMRALLALCRWGGLRRGEALRLRVKDYNAKGRMLTVLPEVGPTGARVEGTKQRARFVPVRRELAAVLDKSVGGKQPDDPICGDIPRRNLERSIRGGVVGGRSTETRRRRRYLGVFARAGLAPIEEPLQTLRRNCGTEWAAQGIPIADVAKWMGNSIEVAGTYYVRTTPGTFARVTGLGKTAGKMKGRRRAGIRTSP